MLMGLIKIYVVCIMILQYLSSDVCVERIRKCQNTQGNTYKIGKQWNFSLKNANCLKSVSAVQLVIHKNCKSIVLLSHATYIKNTLSGSSSSQNTVIFMGSFHWNQTYNMHRKSKQEYLSWPDNHDNQTWQWKGHDGFYEPILLT